MELYIDTLGGLDMDGSTNKNLPYFVVETWQPYRPSTGRCSIDAAESSRLVGVVFVARSLARYI